MPYANKEAQREYQRRWVAARRAEYMGGKKCEYCGEPADDFHHLDPDAKESHRIWSWSRKRIEAELEKCVPVCESCHQQIHTPREGHGTCSMYQHHGCRCDKCKEAMRLYFRDYRKRKKSACSV